MKMTGNETWPPFRQRLLALLQKTTTSAKYLLLLLSLEVLTWSDVFYGVKTSAQPAGFGWVDLNAAVTLLLGIFAINRRKWMRRTAVLLAALALGWTWMSEFVPIKPMCIASDLSMGLFFAFTACAVWHDIGRKEGVTVDTLIGSVCAYMLLAAMWAFAYSLVDLLAPGSFQFPAAAVGAAAQTAPRQDYTALLYYSFVTLSSVGYGDIIPLKPAARMLASGEAVAGQFYMAILVARLVSLYLEQTRQKRSSPQPSDTGPNKSAL